jgi:hypothetical protein
MFAMQYPDETPIDLTRIEVSNPCGNRVILVNRSGIAVEIDIEHATTGWKRKVGLAAHPVPPSTKQERLMIFDPGTVSFRYGSRSIGRVTLPGKPCTPS